VASPRQTSLVTREERDDLSILFDLFVLNQHVRAVVSKAMADSVLRPDEYAVYSLVFTEGSVTPGAMARMLGTPPTTVSDYVRAMIERGHAVRAPNPRDSRSYLVALTQSGLQAHREAGRMFDNANLRMLRLLQDRPERVRRSLTRLREVSEAAMAELVSKDVDSVGTPLPLEADTTSPQ